MNVPTRLLRAQWPPSGDNLPGAPRFEELRASIEEEGIREPLTINLDWGVIDGHHRLAIARHIGIEAVEVRIWTGVEFVQ